MTPLSPSMRTCPRNWDESLGSSPARAPVLEKTTRGPNVASGSLDVNGNNQYLFEDSGYIGVDLLPGREFLDMSRDELAIMIHADGQGPQGSKQQTWSTLRQNAPEGLAWGWKNFYDEDLPMLTPEETVAVEPRPDLISYQ